MEKINMASALKLFIVVAETFFLDEESFLQRVWLLYFCCQIRIIFEGEYLKKLNVSIFEERREKYTEKQKRDGDYGKKWPFRCNILRLNETKRQI